MSQREVREFLNLQKQIKDLQQESARTEGAIETLISDLNRDYGISPDEIPKKIEGLNQTIKETEERLAMRLESFKEKYGEFLDQ